MQLSRPGRTRASALAAGLVAVLLPIRSAAEEQDRGPLLQDDSSPGPRIVDIEIKGSRSLSERALLQELSTCVGAPYDPATLENDLRRLLKSGRYRTVRWEGPARLEGGVALTLSVEERPALRKIEFVGNEKIETETLRDEVENVGLFSSRRSRYSEAVAHRALVALRKLYRRETYFLAEVSFRTEAYEGADERGLESVKLVFDIEENERAPVRGLRIVGNRAFSDKALQGLIHYALRALGKGDWSKDYDRLRLARVLTEVERVYRDNGYLDAEVELDHIELFTQKRGERKPKQWLVVHIEITEGPAYTVGNVRLTLDVPREGPPLEVSPDGLLDVLAEPSAEFKKIHKPLKAGDVYSQTAKRQAVKRLQTALGQHGRIATKVRSRDLFGEEGTKIDLEFVVKPSRPYRVRAAHVRGNYKTKASVFTRELVAAGIRPENRDPRTGEVVREASLLDSRKLDLAEKNIFHTNLVKSEFDDKTGMPRHGVTIRPLPVGDGLADLYIDVNENETGQLMMGFSMSSNGELAGQIEFRQDNFDLFGWPRSWGDWTNAFMGAGQSFSLSAHFGFGELKRNVYKAEFVEPYFLGVPLRFRFGLYDTQVGRESYNESRTGLDGSLGRRWSLHRYKRRKLRTFVSWGDELVGIDPDANAPGMVLAEEGFNRIRRAGLGVAYDSLDNWRRPTEGIRAEAFRDAAGGYLGGDASFTKAKLDFRAHGRVARGVGGNPHIVNLRLRVNYADPYYGDPAVPFYERYYAGGIGTIRGFEYRSIGPHENPPPDRGDPVGGNFRLLGTLEYTVPLEPTNSIRAILFLDAGNVWSNPSDFDVKDMKRSAGVGIELFPAELPFPISMYWSYVVDKKREDETQVFSFMFGNMFFF